MFGVTLSRYIVSVYKLSVNEDARELAEGLHEVATAFAVWGRGERGELSPTAVAALVRLAREGPARGGELAAHVQISQPSMTKMVARLSEQGLVRRDPDPGDGRAAALSVTPAGSHYLARSRDRHVARLASVLVGLPVQDLRDIAAAMPALIRLTGALRRSRLQPEDA